jgi:hypothetical protein
VGYTSDPKFVVPIMFPKFPILFTKWVGHLSLKSSWCLEYSIRNWWQFVHWSFFGDYVSFALVIFENIKCNSSYLKTLLGNHEYLGHHIYYKR